MPRVTALRHQGRGIVEVWLDGRPWRRLHEDVVVGAGLRPGTALDRERAAAVARERRRAAAMASAVRALRHRDHSAASLRRRLAERAVSSPVAAETVGRLERLGAVDDTRAARARAAALAEREWGDAGIRADLEQRGFPGDVVAACLADLEPEGVRLARALERRGVSLATARTLARKGFAEDALADVVASLGDGAIA